MICPDLLQWLVDHQETVSIWTVPVLGLVGIAMGAWRLVLADRQDKRGQQEREEQRQSWLMKRYERRVERFGKAADKVLDRDKESPLHGLDSTLALQEIEAIADADPARFRRQAKMIIKTLDHRGRFPSRKEIEEYERIVAEEQDAAEEEEADPDNAEWRKDYHRPYRDDEPRIGIIDLSFISELQRLVAKWGKVPRKQKAEPNEQREER